MPSSEWIVGKKCSLKYTLAVVGIIAMLNLYNINDA